jgi:LPXTG-motif cell wall-anchored protein
MILGQSEEEEGTNWYNVAAGAIETAVGGLSVGISRLIGGKDVEAAAESNLPEIPATPEDVTDVVGAGKATARKPSASYGEPTDAGYASMGTSSAPIWPWAVGLAVLGGGAYWLLKRRKRHGKAR